MTMTTPLVGTIEHDIGERGRLTVRAGRGDVRVRGIDGAVARLMTPGGGTPHAVTVDRRAGELAIRATDDDSRFGRRPDGAGQDLDIEVPAEATVSIETASGTVRVIGLGGDQHYRTTSGDVGLRAASGRLEVEVVSGDVDIAADGPLALVGRTVSGDFVIRGETLSTAEIATTSGDVRVTGRFDDAGPFVFETVSGDITLAVANDITIEATTITGSLRSERPARLIEGPGQRTLVVGAGGPAVAFRSTSGDLRIARAEAGRPAAPAPAIPAPPTPPTAPMAPDAPAEDDAALRILRALERGDIDVAEAERRLAGIEPATDDSDESGEVDDAG
jgi:hypothetical protein